MKPDSVSGTVESYNFDPRGSYNGINLKDGDHISQLNMPPELGAQIAVAAPVGQKIQATAYAELVVGNRSIYRLATLTGPDGKQLTLPNRDQPLQMKHTEGTVKQLNYAPRRSGRGVPRQRRLRSPQSP